jgi:hypothetical protein
MFQGSVPTGESSLIEASVDGPLTVLRPRGGATKGRILYVNSYGMALAWRLYQAGEYPGHHLWGCLELVRKGYEVLLPEPPRGNGILRRLMTDDAASLVARRLNKDDIVYCGHNVLFWIPILKAIKAVRCRMVGLLFAREPLLFGGAYDGIIAHTPTAYDRAEVIGPRAKRAYLGWGVDMPFFPVYPYEPRWGLSCGKTFRDFSIITKAFEGIAAPLKLFCSNPGDLGTIPENVQLIDERMKGVSNLQLCHDYYRYAAFTLLTLLPDPPPYRRAVGFTNLIESMVMARPVVVTRTGALLGELDVEKEGIGLYAEPGDVLSLRMAVRRLLENPKEAKEMGRRGRALCERHYNMDRFGDDLYRFFQSL